MIFICGSFDYSIRIILSSICLLKSFSQSSNNAFDNSKFNNNIFHWWSSADKIIYTCSLIHIIKRRNKNHLHTYAQSFFIFILPHFIFYSLMWVTYLPCGLKYLHIHQPISNLFAIAGNCANFFSTSHNLLLHAEISIVFISMNTSVHINYICICSTYYFHVIVSVNQNINLTE